MRISNKYLLIIAWSMLSLGLLISVYFIISTAIDGYCIWGKDSINFVTTGQFGDFFGGVVGTLFALTGTLLLFLNFNEQTRQNKKEAFEAKFYEMLKIHNTNVKEISVGDKKGREAIEELTEKLHSIFIEVESAFLRLKSIQDPQEIETNVEVLTQIKDYINDNDKVLLLAHKLSYGYFFYGIQEYHMTKDKNNIIYHINLAITTLIVQKLLSVNEGYELNVSTHYNSTLGHYYRHLFQIIKLVANNNILEENEKYEFTKIVRAQLSDYEQILLYYNSLSVMGENWITPLGENEIKKMSFIARFRLIKNIPYFYIYFGINPAKLFKTEKNVWNNLGKDFFETNLEK